MTPSVSIVITNFNYARFVSHAIASALDQRKPTEVIVVDDGSTDGSAAAIEAFGSKITAVFTANRGQGAAFNAGWRAAHGDIVMFLDADDVLDAEVAGHVAAVFAADPRVGRVQFPLTLIDAGGAALGGSMPPAGKRLFSGDPTASLIRCPDDIVWQTTSGNAFSRRTLAAILPMPEEPYRICADYYLSNISALHGLVVALVEPGGAYRVHGDNSHFSTVETLARLRDNIRRTDVTHRLLIDECARLGIAAPAANAAAVRSVSSAANRLISYRLGRAAHPLPGDTRLSLVTLGVRSAAARIDLPRSRRMLYAAWFLAAAGVPRRWLPVVARPYVTLAATAVRRGRRSARSPASRPPG
jgi:hypothetical protein